MKVTGKLFPFVGISALLPAITGCGSGEKNINPNILFIMSDDHAYQAISAYNDRFSKLAPTPNIDRIAGEGMLFNRCLVANSICGPSRATILTGKYSHMNGFVQNEAARFDSSQMTFPKLLQKAGYLTAVIGKWHLESQPTGFDHWDILPGQGHYYNPDFLNSNGIYRTEGYVTDIISQKSIEWLEKASKTGKPFLLMMHHKAPHREWEPGPKYLERFRGVEFPLPETLFDDYSGRGRAEHEQDMTIRNTMRLDSDLKMWTDTTSANWKRTLGRMNPQQRQAWDAIYEPVRQKMEQEKPEGDDLVRWKYQRYMNDYLACIQSVDESVGKVLDFLKKSGLENNTLVVYCSDQGFYLGEHGWFDKRFMFEQSYRTPLLMRWPGVIAPGSISNDIVSNIDFAETFLEAAGVPAPDDMQGRSMVPLLKGNTPPDWRQEHYYHYYEYPGWHSVKRHYGISTTRYKLMHFYYDIDEWELFDLATDPFELKNVYDDPSYRTVRDSLETRLEWLRNRYHDSDELTRKFLPAAVNY